MMPDWFNNIVGPILLSGMMVASIALVVVMLIWLIKTEVSGDD